MLGFESTAAFAVLTVIFGAISCFWGYRLFRFVLGVLGFFGGAYLAGSIAVHFKGEFGLVAIIAAIAGGLLGAMIVSALYPVAVFVAGALAGWIAGTMIIGAVGRPLHYLILIALAVGGGLLALSFERFIIIVSTAFSGSWGIVSGLLFFFGSGFTSIHILRNPRLMLTISGSAYWFVLFFWAVLGLAGVLFQLRRAPGPEPLKPQR